jgi:hypothetical protein
MNWLASLCMQFAAWLMRHERGDWARAMCAEFQCVSTLDRPAWAFGCLVAAIKQRLVPMDTGNLRISRWVMLVETLGCFGYLTLGWYAITFGSFGLLRFDSETIEKVFFGYPGGPYLFWVMVVSTATGLVGPIGLFLGLRYVWQGRALANRILGWSMIGVTLGVNVIGTIAGYLVGPKDFQVMPGLTLLMALLPVAGILHLMYLARPAAPPRVLAIA